MFSFPRLLYFSNIHYVATMIRKIGGGEGGTSLGYAAGWEAFS